MNIKQSSVLLSRIALFVIYFWFGLLKVIGQSPASGMVQELYTKTLGPMLSFMHLSFITAGSFVVLFGVLEVIIGVLFLIPGKERWALVLFALHMITTTLPLFFLKASVWTHMLVPTLEGQYVIKNLALIACAVNIWSILPALSKDAVVTEITN